MKRVLEVYTFPSSGGYIGGVATMVSSYLNAKDEFGKYDYSIDLFNHSIKHCTRYQKINLAFSFFTQRKSLKNLLSQEHYDLIHIHTSRKFLFLKDVLLAKFISVRFAIPVVITIHVGAIETVYERIGWFRRASISLLNHYVAVVVFLSTSIRNQFINAGLESSKGKILYNFHNLNIEPDSVSESPILNLLFVGSIHKEKGIFELLDAVSELNDDTIHLDICGQITDLTNKSKIESRLSELGNKAVVHGYVSGFKKEGLFKKADVLVLPSYHEGLPLVIMEALGAGCAIISTRVGAIPEILGDENALWASIGSSHELAKQISRLLTDKALLSHMKNENYALGKFFSLSKHIYRLCVIYDNITS